MSVSIHERNTQTERQLVSVSAPIEAVTVDEANRTIKGFASVHKSDRFGDIVPPKEFNVAQFMAIPTMMLNHRYFIDAYGNEVGIGTPLEMFAAKLVAVDDATMWGVADLDTGEIRNTYPREKVPDLSEGDAGLFIVAKITRDEVWKMVVDREVNGLSWRGLSRVSYVVNPQTNTTQRMLRNIDLYEVSLVNIPANQYSSFMVGKSAIPGDGNNYVATAATLYKTHFPTREAVEAFIKSHPLLQDGGVYENENSWAIKQRESLAGVDARGLIVERLAPGVQVVQGPLETVSFSAHKLEAGAAEFVRELFKDVGTMTTAATTPKPDEANDDRQKQMEQFSANLAGAVAASLGELLKPSMEAISAGLASIQTAVQKNAEAPKPDATQDGTKPADTTAKPDEAKPAETAPADSAPQDVLKGVFEVFTKSLEGINDRLSRIEKVAPAATDRPEDVSKSVQTPEDKNAVFNNLWPFAR